jgi:hypothetical protein
LTGTNGPASASYVGALGLGLARPYRSSMPATLRSSRSTSSVVVEEVCVCVRARVCVCVCESVLRKRVCVCVCVC